MNLIQQSLRSRKIARGFDGRVHHAPAQRIEAGRARVPRHLHVAEAVIGEARLVSLHAFAAQDVDVARFGLADVFAIDHAVVIEQFREAQADFRAARAKHVQHRPAAEVLAQVIHVHTGPRDS